MKLKKKVQKILYNVINLCIVLKSLINSDITYKDGEILNVNGITFSNGKYKVDIDIYKNIDN